MFTRDAGAGGYVVAGVLRWLAAVGVGCGGFALVWWSAEAGFDVDRATALSVAAVLGPFLAAPFAWWASRDPPPTRAISPSRVGTGGSAAQSAGHVFLSYRHRSDQGYVERLARFLMDAGVPVWFDREIITGSRWDRVIRERVDTCVALVVVMSPDSEESDWVTREIDQAELMDKPILPLLLRGQRFFRLANLQYEDVTDGRMPTATLVGRLRAMVESSSMHDDSPNVGEVPARTRDRATTRYGLPSATPSTDGQSAQPATVAGSRPASQLMIGLAAAGMAGAWLLVIGGYVGTIALLSPLGTRSLLPLAVTAGATVPAIWATRRVLALRRAHLRPGNEEPAGDPGERHP